MWKELDIFIHNDVIFKPGSSDQVIYSYSYSYRPDTNYT